MSHSPRKPCMYFRGIVACLCFFCLFLATMPVAAADRNKELRIGIEPEHNIFDQMEQYRHLAGYLSGQLGVKVTFTIMSRYGEVINRFKALKLDGAVLTSYTAAMGIKELNLEPIAHPVNLNGESTSNGYIFVRKDSGIRDSKAMAGKNIVFVDPSTTEGYLFPLAYLKRHGVTEVSKFFHHFSYSGSHASAIFAVLDGRADIGAAKNTVFNKLIRNDPSIQQELEIIATSPNIPEFTLCISNEIDRDVRNKLAASLYDMDKTALGRKVLAEFKAQRFIAASTKEFAAIEKMAQDAGVAITGTGISR